MKKRNFAIVTILLMAGAARTTTQDSRPADGINPDAPKKTSEYAFTLGNWEVLSKYRNRDGTFRDAEAWCDSRLILDGFAFQEDWRSKNRNGGMSYGTTIRTFDPKADKWVETYVPVNSTAGGSQSGSFSDGRMVIEYGNDRRKERWTIFNISDDHFTGQYDALPAGRENWIEKIYVHEYHRAGAEGKISQLRPADSIHPDAPKETSQYAFTLGKWNVSSRYLKQDGTYFEGKAWAEGRLILDGFAFQSDWRSENPDGEIFRGTTIRTFDPRGKEWIETWVPMNSDEVSILKGTFSDGQIVVQVDDDEQQRSRWRIRNVSDNHYTVQKDQSGDGGKIWVEEVVVHEFERVP